ncbi:hypothetical protein N402_08535 [Helicobacter pylori FD423]|nr:hypothetical protein N402_08535 [Helicobacter pylori FD423]
MFARFTNRIKLFSVGLKGVKTPFIQEALI